MSHLKKFNSTSEDINIDKLRGRSIILSPNLFREFLAHSELSSILCMNRIEVQNNDFLQIDQIKEEKFQLLYTSFKERIINNPNKTNSMGVISFTYIEETNNNNINKNQPHGFDSFSILYLEFQLIDQES